MNRDDAIPAAVPIAWSNQGVSDLIDGSPERLTATTTTSARSSSSSRFGRRRLAALRQSLSARDWQVLETIADHRFLTTKQVEGFCFHTHATPLTAARVCRRVLRRLDSLKVITHLERRIGGVRAGSASYVWKVGTAGSQLLANRSVGFRRPRPEPGLLFLDHCLAVAEVHLGLVRAHRAHHVELIDVQTEPDCWRSYTGLGGASLVLQPDLYAVTGAGDYEDHWFLEVDRGTENLTRLLAKCRRYDEYKRTGTEQERIRTFPVVVWVMRSQPEADRLHASLSTAFGEDSSLFRVTTSEQVVELIQRGAV